MSQSQKNANGKSILVVAAHPDDEILGCGATMARHAAHGDHVRVLLMAEGMTSRRWPAPPADRDRRLLVKLTQGARRANDIVGSSSVEFGGFPDNRMDSMDLLSVIKRVEQTIERFRPEVVYTHHAADVNIDHQITHQAVLTACRPIPGHPVKRLLFSEVVSSTHWQNARRAPFSPTWFIDVSHTLALKLKALRAYSLEMRSWPHARSYKAVEALARWRGSVVGCEAAEAFETGRILE